MFVGLFMYDWKDEVSLKLVFAETQEQAEEFLGDKFMLQWGTFRHDKSSALYGGLPWIEWEVDIAR